MRSILVVVALFAAGCSSGTIVSSPSPIPSPTPTVSSPAPTPAPTPTPAPAPTTIAVDVLVTRADGRPIAGCDVTVDGRYIGQTDHYGRQPIGTLTIGQSYTLDLYQGEYVPIHTAHIAAPDVPSWSYVLNSIR